jgi:prepilin-type N-terminal cleavage/methylation domain-containing protein
MNIKNKKSGFTLIELIFVLAIIGVTLTLGLSYITKLAERTKEKTTALQMQQILQAGMTYYVKNNKWPDDGTSASIDTFGSYIPAISRLDTNPWGKNSYVWSGQTSGGMLFSVSTDVSNAYAAARIMSLLPNASVSGSTVKAEITIPGQAQAAEHGYIMRVGVVPTITSESSSMKKDNASSPFLVMNAADATSCNGIVKVVPITQSVQLRGTIGNVGKLEMSNFRVSSEEVRCGINNVDYCIHYYIDGDSGGNSHLRPTEIVISYMVLCMPKI